MNFALKLTVFRVMLIPLYLLIYFLFEFPFQNWIAWGVFAIASVTDFFDGYIARKYNQSSKLGAMLDPVADKILVAVVMISLLVKHADGWEGLFLMICAVIIIGREIVVSALREFMSGLNIRNAVAVQYIGKVKTTAQIFALGFLIVYEDAWFIPTKEIGWILLFIAAFLTLWSMVDYFKSAIKALGEQGIDIYQ
ncbi:MAG: CDP-diacylglycerol--glycerol-3-phosphate 3-phosphatidyltransferase [Gammaproteobacteria bacterium]|nr:MAG: CDP-diacylglycerol--glycerol-3-phosphate 3-phosphatidyltransferase [Gammaproteobacteria bacterium]